MIYSVWNQGTGVYDYFQTKEVQAVVNAPIPKHLIKIGGNAKFGVPIDRAAWPLPSGAIKIGSGEYAKGRIASRSGGDGNGLSGIVDTVSGSPVMIGLVLIGMYVALTELAKGGK